MDETPQGLEVPETPQKPPVPSIVGEDEMEAELRCKNCNKMMTKLIVTVERLAPGARTKVVKVGFETRCPRCKEFIYHLFVV